MLIDIHNNELIRLSHTTNLRYEDICKLEYSSRMKVCPEWADSLS